MLIVDVNSLQGQGSVAVADVPDSPLSTVHVLVMHGSTASTLPPLLLNALHGDTCQHGVGSVDAVAVESDFCHGSIVRGDQWERGQAETTSSGVTLNHLIGLPEVRRQIVAGSSIARAIRYAPLMVGV